MKELENILINQFKLRPTCKHLNGPLCVVAQNNDFDAVVAAPGYIDSDKWVVRFMPHVFFEGFYFDLGAFLEERFYSRDEVVEYLTTKQGYIYSELFKYMLSEFTKIVSENDLAKRDPESFYLLNQTTYGNKEVLK